MVGLSGFNQRIAGGTGVSAPGGVGKQPGFSSHCKGSDGIFRQDIADVHMAMFTVTSQTIPLIEGIADGFVGQRTSEHSRFVAD